MLLRKGQFTLGQRESREDYTGLLVFEGLLEPSLPCIVKLREETSNFK